MLKIVCQVFVLKYNVLKYNVKYNVFYMDENRYSKTIVKSIYGEIKPMRQRRLMKIQHS